jgi:DNA-formamidopyrimidine glycosylase
MTGHVRLEPTVEYLKLYNQAKNTNETTEQYLKHAHLRITYIECDGSSKNIFYYHDVRRFGHWDYMERVDLTKKLQSLGSDILQETLPSDMIIKNFRKHNKMNVCKCLMDQRTLAGIGAYIKSEILYMAKINPYSSIKDLSDIDLTNLYYAAKDIAKRAYEAGGASLYTYTGINGDKTDFKNTLQVYGKLTDPHGNSVEKISDADSPDKRATHWVPNIQTIGKPVRIVVNIHKKSN